MVGVGTWQFGGEWGHDFTQDEVDQILDRAEAEGINLIDTAECYGDHLSERLIGDYLKRRDRSRWVIATKFGHDFTGYLDRREDFSAKDVRRQLEDSLRALLDNARRLKETEVAEVCNAILDSRPRGHPPAPRRKAVRK